MLRACTEGNPAKSSRVGAEDKFRFTLLPCTTSSSTCTRACTYKRTYVPVYGTVSQRRNRRGSFRATPARTWRGQPAGRLSLSLSLSLFPPLPLFHPQRSLSLSLAFLVASIDPIEPRLRTTSTATTPNIFSRQVLSRRGPRV